MATLNNNNKEPNDKWSLKNLRRPWNAAQEHCYWDESDGDGDLDDDDLIQLCKTTKCEVETYRVNVCIKVEKAWDKHSDKVKFHEMDDECKKEAYEYMEAKAMEVIKLSDMDRYQAGRKRRRLRLQTAYKEQRHRQRFFERMQELANVPDVEPTAAVEDNRRTRSTIHYMYDSIESSQTVIRRPSIPRTAKKKGKSAMASQPHVVNDSDVPFSETVTIESTQDTTKKTQSQTTQSQKTQSQKTQSHFDYIPSLESQPRNSNEEDVEVHERESMKSFDIESENNNNNLDVDVDGDDDDEFEDAIESIKVDKPAFSHFNLRLGETPRVTRQANKKTGRHSTSPASSGQTQSQPSPRTYSQFEQSNMVTSSQDMH